MKQRYNALTTLAVVLLTWVVVMAAASVPALAEEGEAQSEGRDLLELLEEQGIRKDGDASALTIQGLGAKVANLDAGSASDANKKIKERTKQGFHITINMTADWNNQTIEIPSGADVTIKMNGHTINRNRTSGGRNDSAIQVGKNALLSIDGGTKTSFKGMRIYSPSGSYTMQSRNVAGLITGGYNTNGGGGIDMAGGSSVTLNNVFLAGNRAEQNWGVDGHGGGIYVGGENTSITLNNTQIMGNYAYNCGGGIYANNAVCLITLNKSTLDGNVAARGTGGGIHGDSTGIHISGDPTSSIRYSYAKSNGGGVYFKKDSCSLKGLKVESNRSDTATGGGAYANAKKTTFANLTITNNKATYAGGLRTMGADESITSCTITNNSTYAKDGSYSAGACIEGSSSTISGTCVIKDNQGNNGVYLAPEITGTPDNTRGGFVKLDLARGSSVCVIKGSPGNNYVPITPTDARVPNCIRYLTTMNGYHVTYNDSSRVIYIVKGSAGQNENSTTGKAARIPQTQTTLNPSQTTPATTGEKYNGRDVVRGYVRYPSVEDGTKDFATSFYYSDGYFLDNPTKYNNHLATLSMCMAMSGFYLNAGSTTDYINKHASARQFMSDIGCADDDIYVNDYNVQKPGSFTIGVTIASKTIKDASGTEYTLVPIAVRGAGYEAEWTSNVTMKAGVGTEHWGFADAANKVTAEVNSYLARHNLTEKAKQGKVKFWIAGYSRAGATSNLTARRLLDQYASGAKKCDVYGYPMEAPQGGSDDYDKANPERYYSIHNIINKADLVPLVGPTKMGFKRYGVDHFIPGTAAGNVTKSSVGVDRAGGLSQTAGTTYSGHESATAPSPERTVNTWSDNQSYATNSGAKYNAARSAMLPQLEAIDPSINFDDFFHTADMDFFPSPNMRYKAAKAGGNEEEFIVQFINDVQRWAIGNRASYSKNLETAFQNVIGTVFSMDSASMQGFTNRASTCMDRIPTIAPFSSKRSLRNIYADVIGAWYKRSEKEKTQYIDTFITAIDGTGAYDYLTAEQKAKVRGSLPTFLDFAFKIVDGDYKNESFGGTAKCMMLPTFALNASRIMSNHYPEVNLAWLRAEDSYYNNDKTAYVIAKADRVASPAAKVGSQELATTENTVPTGLRVVTLDVKDLKGEAVYYKVSKNGKQVSENTCKNGYEIYRGPFRISFEKDATYTVTAYAMWHGTKSGEVTYTIKTLVPEHKVTILNAPNMEASKGKVVTAKEGEKVELKAERRVVQSDTRESVFTGWTFTDEKGTNRTNLLPQGTNTHNTSLMLPAGGQSGLSANYSLVAKANYETRLRTDNLHEIEIAVGGQTVKTFKAREGETVTYTPTLDNEHYIDHWTAKLSRTDGGPFNVTDALKPQLGSVWAGKKKSELRFVVPRHGDVLKIVGSNNPTKFLEGDRLILDTTLEQKIKKVAITNFPAPQAETASGQYTCTHYPNDTSSLSPDYKADASTVKWDKSVQTKVNRDTTTTTTTTYTTYVVTNWSSANMYSNNVQVETNVDNCTATVEPYQDGKVRIRLQVVKSQTEGTPKNTIYCNAYDINDTDKTPLTKDGQTIETWRVIEGTSFVADWSPSVPGGQPTWHSYAPDDSGLEAVSGENNKYQINQGSNAKLLLSCEQKPVINNVEVKAFPAPKVGESLATKPADGAMTDAINLVFNKPADSVFTTYAPQITELTWIPSIPESGKAQGQTQYTCIIKLKCADNKQIYLDRNTSVTVAEGLGVTTSRFLLDRGTDGKLKDDEGTLFLTFQTTSRSTDHTVTVKDNAEAGDPATHTWKEGEAKTVAAKDDYADKVFERWAVTVTPKSGDPVSLETDEQLQAMGLTATKLTQSSLKFTMPTVSAEAGATFGEGYALSLAAVYRDKADKLFVNNIEPTAATEDLADTAALTWHWMANETEQTGTATVGVVWTAESAYSETTGTHTFTATMRLDAQHARQLKRGDDTPSVNAMVANDLYTMGKATWNADGSLTVSVSYGPVSVPLAAYQVSVGAYDANSPTSKLKTKEGDSLVDMPDVVQVVVSETSDSDGFSLAAPVIDGAEFVRWEIPTGSKIERVGGQDSNKFKFASDATAQDTIAIHALYQPVVSKVTLEVGAPKAGEPLATGVTPSIALANADAFASVAPSVAATNLTWTPNVNSAAYDTEYAAAATLEYKVKTVDDQGAEQVTNTPWLCGYAENVEVSCEGASFTWFDTSASAAYVFFPATERDDRHQSTIRDFAEDDEDEGEPRQETWYEGETKYLVAKQYDDKLFTGWTIKGAGDKDVTNDVLAATAAKATDAAIAIAVPVPEETDADLPEGYALTITANYQDKIDEVRVTIPQPMGASGTVAWTYDEETTKMENVSITWSASHTEDTSTGDKITSTAYVATLHLTLSAAELEKFAEDPFVVAQLADGSAEDGPQIDAGEVTFERAADGIVITIPFVTTEEVLEARTVTLWACDVNADEHPVLDGTEDEEYLAYEDDEDGIILCAPSVEGAVFAGWEFDEGVFQKTPVLKDESIAVFAFKQGAEVDETNIVKALYKPVVDTVRVDFAAPRASEKLATKDDATVVYDLANDAFEGIGGTVSELTWTPAHTTADFDEKYIAALTCTPDKDTQYALDDDVVGTHGQTLADFEVGENGQHKVYVDFDATEPRNNHKVTVVDNAGGLPTTYLWQETATKHLVAKPSEDKAFSHWTVTDQKGADVTRQVLQGEQVDDATIELNLPVGAGAASFPTTDYALTITANYAGKADKLAITGLAVPTATSANTTSSWQWTDGTGTYTAPAVDVMWTRASKDGGYAYTATMSLDASKAQGICHNGLQITVSGDQSQAATATWDAAGNLTVTTTFVQAADPEADATFRTVRMLAYDVNANAPLSGSIEPLELLLYDRSYDVLVAGGTAKLVPYQVSGGVSCGFAADSGAESAAQSVVDNVLTLKSGAAADSEAVVHALFKPVVNSVCVNVATPSNGQSLSETATASATRANTAFAAPGAVSGSATWKPTGTADATKEYEAAVTPQYKKAVDGDDPWQCAYAPEAYATTSGPAYTTFDAVYGTAYLYFDENSPTQLISVKPVDDVYTTYDHNSAEDIQELLGQQCNKVNIEVTANAANEATVTWEKPVLEVDGGKLEGAIWHARGKLTLPDGVQAQDLYVTATVYVKPSNTLDLVHVDQPADIYGLQAGADEATVRDQLPTQTDLILEEGVVTTGAITWNTVKCVDNVGTFRYSAKWTATGIVTLPSDVSNPNDRVSRAVTMDAYVDLADLPDNLAEMPYAMPESDIYDTEKAIILDTDEENGTIYYRIASGVKGDYSEIYPSDFREYLGEPIYLDRDSIDDSSMLCIEAYTVAPNKEQSYTATFLYELSDYMYIPEGEELVFDGTEQVGVWLVDDYELVGPSAGARIDEDGDAVATNAGTYAVVAKAQKKLTWYLDWPDEESSPTTTTDDQTITFTIAPAPVQNCDIDLAKSVAYTGKAVTPKPKVTMGDWTAVEGRDYTLTYKDNVTVGKATVTITGKGNLKDSVTLEFEVDGGDQLDVAYAGHVQTYGDIPAVQNGASLGTVGQSKRIESFSATVTGGTIEYRAHVQRQGWDEGWKRDGELCGTTGQSKRVEAVQVRLSDRLTAAGYHVWYRVHAQTYGWLGWACDGAPAGTSGQSKRLEAIEMVVLRGDAKPEGYDASRTSFNGRLAANAHVQTYGWLGYASAGKFGTTGKSKRMEAFWLKPGGLPPATGVEYQSHVQRQGWETEWRSDGAISGTMGKSRRVEAVRIRLTGEAAEGLSVWYRVHSQTFGWSGWARDGQDAGTAGYSKRVESIEVVVLSKDAAAPGPTKNALRSR